MPGPRMLVRMLAWDGFYDYLAVSGNPASVLSRQHAWRQMTEPPLRNGRSRDGAALLRRSSCSPETRHYSPTVERASKVESGRSW